MVKLGVIADVHGNYPALREVLKSLQDEGCEAIYHAGDAIAIGPYPRESLECLIEHPKVSMVKGNHEDYFAYGIPSPLPENMSDNEVVHQQWTHSQLSNALRKSVQDLPYVIKQQWEDVTITVCHSSFQSTNSGYAAFDDLRHQTCEELDRAFSMFGGDLILYGHTHLFCDVQGVKHYINPGSVGCHPSAYANYTLIEIDKGNYTIHHRTVPYEKELLINAMFQKGVPDREFIYRSFF